MTELEKGIVTFKLDELTEKFQRFDFDEIEEIFDSNLILIIVNHVDKIIWLWHGKDATIRTKFIATQEAPKIRDKHGIDYKILAIDEGNETQKFKSFFSLS